MESGQKQTAAELAEAMEAISVDTPPASEYEVGFDGPADAFNAMSMRAVRPQHAMDAARNPDDVAIYGYQEARMFVATKAVSVPASDFVLAAIGVEIGRKRLINSAYRLYGEAAEVQRLAANATAAFQTFLERFAIPYETRGREVMFVPIVTGTIPAGTQPSMEAVLSLLGIKWRPGERPERAFTLHATPKFSTSGGVTIAWPFLIDTAAYQQELARHRR